MFKNLPDIKTKKHIIPSMLALLLLFPSFVIKGEIISVKAKTIIQKRKKCAVNFVPIRANRIDTVSTKHQKRESCFINTDSLSIDLYLSPVKGVDFSTSSKLLASATNNLITDREKAFRLWRICSSYGFHKYFPYNSNLPDNTTLRALVNFPYFMCGEKASILVGFAQLAGLKARRISLDGHEVAELFYDSKWHMFDADGAVVFFDRDYEVLSVKELAESPFRLIRKKNAYYLPYGWNRNLSDFRRYVKNYLQDSINKISYPKITDSVYTMAVRLNPQDSLFYRWAKKKYFLIDSKRSYSTQGEIKSSLSLSSSYTKQSDASFIFSNEIPYYIKRIVVQSPDTVLYKNLEFVTVNRISGDTLVLPLKPSIKKRFYEIAFDAPTGTQIYYKYQIRIAGLTEEQVRRLKISTFFEFNPLTFPFFQQKSAIIQTQYAFQR